MQYTGKLRIQTCTFNQIPSIIQAVLSTVMHCTDAVKMIASRKK
jgi:hypothetical protein